MKEKIATSVNKANVIISLKNGNVIQGLFVSYLIYDSGKTAVVVRLDNKERLIIQSQDIASAHLGVPMLEGESNDP